MSAKVVRWEDLQEFLATSLGLLPEEVTREARLNQDLGADSLDLVEIVTLLEDDYGVKLPIENFGLEDGATAGQLLDLLNQAKCAA